jgi:biopolymer transport protein TolR
MVTSQHHRIGNFIQRDSVQSRMAMNSSSPAQINVTPMIDILLVLLIIFMVIIPNKSVGLDANVPQPAPAAAPPSAMPPPLVLSIDEDRTIHLNAELLDLTKLDKRLREIVVLRPHEVLFVQGARTLDFEDVAAVLDVARGAGIDRVGLLTKKLE